MRKGICLIVSLLLLFFCGIGGAFAAVEKNVVGTLSVPGGVAASAVSGDGALLFLLGTDGKLSIYEKNGTLKDTLAVEGHFDMLEASPAGDLLYLTDKNSGAVQILAVDFVQRIDVQGNAYKGPEDAPVVVAFFSDFQ